MIGTVVNGVGIIIGGVIGLVATRQPSAQTQRRFQLLLGLLTTYVGLSIVWGVLSGPFWHGFKLAGIALLALMLGKLTGRLIGLQKAINSLGQFARQRFEAAQTPSERSFSEGFVTCTILYCVGPLAVPGALQEGLTGDWRTLALKTALDLLATMAFAQTFGRGVVFSCFPVVVYQGTLTLAAQALKPWLQGHNLVEPVSAVIGLMVFSVALVMLEIKKVEMADYLPSLLFAPLLAKWLL